MTRLKDELARVQSIIVENQQAETLLTDSVSLVTFLPGV